MRDLGEIFGVKTPSTSDGNVTVEDSVIVLHGLNRFVPTETIPLSAVQSVILSQPPIGLVAAEFTIITADGRQIKRRSINGRKKITQRFMDEAYSPIVQALAARGQA